MPSKYLVWWILRKRASQRKRTQKTTNPNPGAPRYTPPPPPKIPLPQTGNVIGTLLNKSKLVGRCGWLERNENDRGRPSHMRKVLLIIQSDKVSSRNFHFLQVFFSLYSSFACSYIRIRLFSMCYSYYICLFLCRAFDFIYFHHKFCLHS